jgi:hypothetical protein
MRAERYRKGEFAASVESGVVEAGEVRHSQFSPAAHVITPRRGFLHHGIYMGGGKVVHYAGSTHGLLRGPIEETSLSRFTCGRPIWANCDTPVNYSVDEVIRRARSRVGENQYRLISNNCEHFCEWCLRGAHRSYQVEAWMSVPARALESIIGLMDKFNRYLGAKVKSDVEPS